MLRIFIAACAVFTMQAVALAQNDEVIPLVPKLSESLAETDDEIIKIYYTVDDVSEELTYQVSVEASENGGLTWYPIKALSGDAGTIDQLYGGRKLIMWEVLKDKPEGLMGDVEFKIKIERIKPITEYAADILWGPADVRSSLSGVDWGFAFNKTPITTPRDTTPSVVNSNLGIKIYPFTLNGFFGRSFHDDGGSITVNSQDYFVYGGDLSMHIFPLFSGRLLFSLGYGYRSFLLKDVPDSTKKKQNFTFSQNYFVTRVQWLIGNSFFLKVDGETDRLFNFDNKTAFTAGLGFFIR